MSDIENKLKKIAKELAEPQSTESRAAIVTAVWDEAFEQGQDKARLEQKEKYGRSPIMDQIEGVKVMCSAGQPQSEALEVFWEDDSVFSDFARTPKDIIGDDALTQLIFEGYKVVRDRE